MRKGIGGVSNSASSRERPRNEPNVFCKHFWLKRLDRFCSSWKMHLLFTPRVLYFRGLWRKVRTVNGRGDRSLESKDDRGYPRRFHVPAQSIPVQNQAGGSESRGSGEAEFAECENARHTRIPERTENASAQPAQIALQITEEGRGDGSTKGLRSNPRRSPPNNEALTHHRSWRAVAAPASGP